jgi:hypothetical protein
MFDIRLIYSSVGQAGLDYTALTSILRCASSKNRELGITGILCFGGGAFLQALEGERAAVNRLYAHILRDPRHTDCQVLDCGDIGVRRFSEWSMKLFELDTPTAARRELVGRHFGGDRLDTSRLSGAGAFAFLSELASLERAALLQPFARVVARR